MIHHLLAQYDYAANSTSGSESGAAAIVLILLYIVFIALLLVGMWKLYTKAGKPGWASIVPIYNAIVLLQIAGKPIWWVLLLMIPFVSIVVSVLVGVEIAKRFGKGEIFGAVACGLFGIGYLILGLGSARYNAGISNSPPSASDTTPPSGLPPSPVQ